MLSFPWKVRQDYKNNCEGNSALYKGVGCDEAMMSLWWGLASSWVEPH
jgi:hypothetical protein